VTKLKLTISDIRRAARKLKKMNVPPLGNYYLAPVRRGAMVDLLLCYKRPRATKLYKSMRIW